MFPSLSNFSCHTSSSLAAKYVAQTLPQTKKVWVVGTQSLETELEENGLKFRNDIEPFGETPIMIDTFNTYPIDEEVDVVLVGLDDSFTYTKLCLSSLYVQTAKAKFICTNDMPFV